MAVKVDIYGKLQATQMASIKHVHNSIGKYTLIFQAQNIL